MMCRVIAPVAALFRREVVSRLRSRHPIAGPSLHQRLRRARHRAVRWFNAPIAAIERERRVGPSLWQYDFRPSPELLAAESRVRREAVHLN